MQIITTKAKSLVVNSIASFASFSFQNAKSYLSEQIKNGPLRLSKFYYNCLLMYQLIEVAKSW